MSAHMLCFPIKSIAVFYTWKATKVESSSPYMESVCDLNKCNFGVEPDNRDEKIRKSTAGICLKWLMSFFGGDDNANKIIHSRMWLSYNFKLSPVPLIIYVEEKPCKITKALKKLCNLLELFEISQQKENARERLIKVTLSVDPNANLDCSDLPYWLI